MPPSVSSHATAAVRRRHADDIDTPTAPPGRLLLLSGILLVFDACYLLATSRWGSYVGLPRHSVYIGDVLFGASLLCWLLGGGVGRLWHVGRRSRVSWVALLIVAWTLARLAAGMSFSHVALRDAAPYLYLLAVPIALTATVSRRVVTTVAAAALTIHTAWLALAIRNPSAVANLPWVGPVRILSTRTDFDMAVMGIAIGLGIIAAVEASSWWLRAWGLALAAVATWNISGMNNRGGLLAAGSCVVAVAGGVVWEQVRAQAPRDQRIRTAVAALLLCSATGIGFAQSPALGRLNSTFISPGTQASNPQASATAGSGSSTAQPRPAVSRAPSGSSSPSDHRSAPKASPAQSLTPTRTSPTPTPPAPSQNADEAAGTTQARKTAWRDVYNYTTATVQRAVFGVGFGPNFLKASGGLEVLSGGILSLRAPHNILLNTWARLGAVGLALQIVLLLFGVWAAALAVRRAGLTDSIPWVLAAIALPIVAMVGVILESPFGALPYAVGLGLLARLAQSQPTDEPPQSQP